MSGTTSRPGPRILAALGLAVVLSAVPAHASADNSCTGLSDTPSLVVHVIAADGSPASSSPSSFSMQDICADGDLTGQNGNAINYGLRNARGVEFSDSSNNLLSINRLLGLVQVNGQPLDWHSVAYTEVPNASADPSTLSGADLSPTGDFQADLLPAVYASTNQLLAYVRPLRSDTDVNADEWVQTTGTIDLTIHLGGSLLTVDQGAPTATTVKAGVPDSFSATASGGAAPYSYHWDFADGTTKPGPAPTHTFATPGTYYVSVTARDQQGSYGRSAYVPITVVCNPKTDPNRCGQPPPGGGHHPPGGGHHHPPGHHPPTGPTHGGGHHQGGHPGGSNHPHHGTTHGHQTSTTGRNDGQNGHHDQTGTQPRQKSHHTPGTSSAPGRTVTGRLLVGAQDLAAPIPSLVLQQATAAQSTSQPHWSWPWMWSAALVVPLLIGLGMTGETVQLRRRVARMGA